jgi:hypothetical protein
MNSATYSGLVAGVNFPQTISSLRPGEQKTFQAAIQDLLGAVSVPGQIIKARATEIRSRLGRACENAWRDGPAVKGWLNMEHDARPEWFHDAYYASGLTSLKKIARTCQPHAGEPIADAALAFVKEWEPVVAALESLKAKITTVAVVREEKKETERKARALIPPSKLSQVVAAAVESYRPELAKQYTEFATRRYQAMVLSLGDDLKGVTSSREWARTYENTVQPILGADGKINAAKLRDKAEQYAVMVSDSMKAKIMAKAGELDNPEVKRMDSYRFLITGERFGKKVAIEQTRIVNVSKLGTLFNQWPARIAFDHRSISEAAYKSLKG